MGLRGPKPKRADGCHVTRKGYLRRSTPTGMRMEHDLVWEQSHGPIPPGHEVHHVNGDKQDNRLENLQLLTRLEHKRIHSGCTVVDSMWWKPCSACRESKPLTREHWYFARDGHPAYSWCRPCHVRRVVEGRRRRRAVRANGGAP